MNPSDRTGAALRNSILVLTGVAGNLACSEFFVGQCHLPLYMDSIMTVFVTLYGGLLPGIATGILYNAAYVLFMRTPALQLLFGLCSVATALTVGLSRMSRRKGTILFDLVGLALAVTLVNSLIGGIVSSILFGGIDSFPTDLLIAGLVMQQVPVLAATVMSRIPVNMIDKSIAIFAGYGLYLAASRFFPKDR